VTRYRDNVQAETIGDMLILRVPRNPGATATAFDADALYLDRVLAAVASGTMRPTLAVAAIRDDLSLLGAALAMVDAQRLRPLPRRGDVIVLRIAQEAPYDR
jgi:hypothetical protein